MKWGLVLLIATCLMARMFGQSTKDSLITVIHSSANDIEKLKAYSTLAFDVYLANPDSGILLAQQGYDLAIKGNNAFQQANNMNALGLSYYRKGWYAKSIAALKKSVELFNKIKEKEQIARVYLNLGHVYQTQKDYKTAHSFNTKALKQFEALNDSFRIAICYQTLCVVSRELNDFLKSDEYINQSIKILGRMNKLGELANSHTLRGNLLSAQKKYPEAIAEFYQAINLLDKTGDLSNKAIALENLGSAYEKLENYKTAIKYFNQAFNLFGKLKSDVDQAYERMKRSISLAKTGNYIAANSDLDSAEALFKSENLPDYLQELYVFKSEVLEIQNRPTEALIAYRKHVVLKDSLDNARRVDELLRLQKEFETEQKENQIALLQSGTEIQATELSRRNWAILVLFILGTAGIVILIIWRNRKILKDELAKQQLLNRIASDLHDDIGATLSSIRMYGDVLKTKAVKMAPELAPMADKISTNAQEMIHSMSDIVWTIRAGQEHFSDLQDRIWNVGIELCAPKNIQFSFSGKDEATDFVMNPDLRHDIYMICKEAMNNAVKYSNSSTLIVSLKKFDHSIELIIQDNGVGFDEANVKRGNGLNNMKKRSLEHSGSFEITSKVGSGTIYKFLFQL
ncbi:MAG: tetratricopeptide repeat protein [Bacteroidia bacterium]